MILDIEGTTSATSFLTDSLYPYSVERFTEWIDTHTDDPETVRAVDQIRDYIREANAGTARLAQVLRTWVAEDRKAAPLKTIQGLIWAQGFARGELTAHFYPDVIPALRSWHTAGLRIYVFSSGSIAAQRSWFAHSPDGDLRPLLSGNFDTENAGPKRVVSSYLEIAATTDGDPASMVFLSDVIPELDAARQAGLHTVHVRRPGEASYTTGASGHLTVASFNSLDLTGERPAMRGVGS